MCLIELVEMSAKGAGGQWTVDNGQLTISLGCGLLPLGIQGRDGEGIEN